MNEDYELSVVMPVFNGGSYLSQAIQSVLNQTLRNFEFIIINDGSTDLSLSIIQSFASQDTRIVVVNRENRGLVASLNEGLHLAKSDLIARMDADDVCYPTRLSQQYEYLCAHTDCVAIGTRIQLIDPEGLPIMEIFYRVHLGSETGQLVQSGENLADLKRLADIFTEFYPSFPRKYALERIANKSWDQAMKFKALNKKDASAISFEYWRKNATVRQKIRKILHWI